MTNLIKAAMAALLVVTAVVLLHGQALAGGWRWDDPWILLHAQQYPFWQDLFRPQTWQQFSNASFTPWLIMSFSIDRLLFGLTPSAFYVHQLVAIAASALLFCLCLNLWCRLVFALAGTLLFVVGLPTMLVAEQLMTRHYVEGLAFALVALYLFVQHMRDGRVWMWVAAAVFYLLAISANEIFVPLPVVLLLVPDGDWRARFKASAPFFMVTASYVLWRGYMLGSFTAGLISSSDMAPGTAMTALVSFGRLPALLSGSGWPIFVLLFVVLWGLCIARERKLPWRALLIAMLVLLPLLPLINSSGIVLADRYLLLPWLMICFAMAWCGDRSSRLLGATSKKKAAKKRQAKPATAKVIRAPLAALAIAWISLPLLVILALLHGLPVRQALATVGQEFEVQAEFLWQHNNSHAFVPSGNVLDSYRFVPGLAGLKALSVGQSSPVPVVDDIFLLEQADSRLHTYDVNCQCMRDVTGAIAARLARYQERLRPAADLSLAYRYQQGELNWQFGPWQDGSYHVVSATLGVLQLPPSGQSRMMLAENAAFYLRYSSPEGWITYSGLNHVQRDTPVDWSRNTNQ